MHAYRFCALGDVMLDGIGEGKEEEEVEDGISCIGAFKF